MRHDRDPDAAGAEVQRGEKQPEDRRRDDADPALVDVDQAEDDGGGEEGGEGVADYHRDQQGV